MITQGWQAVAVDVIKARVDNGGELAEVVVLDENEGEHIIWIFLMKLPGGFLLTKEELIFLCFIFLKQYSDTWKQKQIAKIIGFTGEPGLASSESYSSSPP